VAEIEVCGSVFDLGDDELLDRIEADGAEPASSAAAATSVSGKTSISRSAWMNSRLPRLPMRASKSRRRCWSGSGSIQFCKGAAWSKDPAFCSRSSPKGALRTGLCPQSNQSQPRLNGN
jgi:hypothetical protein